MTPREIDNALSIISRDAKQLASRVDNITGFTGELSKLQANLDLFGDPERTAELSRMLPKSRSVARSKKTEVYLEEARDIFGRYMRQYRDTDDLRWALGWLQRCLRIEKAFGSAGRSHRGGGRGGPQRGGGRQRRRF